MILVNLSLKIGINEKQAKWNDVKHTLQNILEISKAIKIKRFGRVMVPSPRCENFRNMATIY